jgi:RNA polymerase sigma-70 factor (ECF subfamily)
MVGQFRNRIAKRGVASFHDSAVDGQLVAAAKRGDELAFETLVKRHGCKIFALALRYTRIREDAEDVVQKTFQKAFVHLQQFEGKSSFSTWATRIAINQALMTLRKRRALHEVPIDDSSGDEGTTLTLQLADASPDPEARCLQREGTRILSAAIRRLSPGMRRAIQLQELRELSVQETAEHMGVSVPAVKATVFRARRKLGQSLRHYMRPRPTCGNGLPAVAEDASRISQIA